MPIARVTCSERPSDAVPVQTCLYMRIFADVVGIVIDDEVVTGDRPEGGQGNATQHQAGQNRAPRWIRARDSKPCHTAQSLTGETPVPRWLRGMAVPAMIQNLTDS